jgi:hypothetical protein
MVSLEQQKKNVDTLYRDWHKMSKMFGSYDRRTVSMFGVFVDALERFLAREEAENGGT